MKEEVTNKNQQKPYTQIILTMPDANNSKEASVNHSIGNGNGFCSTIELE